MLTHRDTLCKLVIMVEQYKAKSCNSLEMKKVTVMLRSEIVEFLDNEAKLGNTSRTEIIQNLLEIMMFEIKKSDLSSSK